MLSRAKHLLANQGKGRVFAEFTVSEAEGLAMMRPNPALPYREGHSL